MLQPLGGLDVLLHELEDHVAHGPHLVHAADDGGVKVENSLYYYQALLRKKVMSELHVYPHGGHGFGLHNKTTPDNWIERLQHWLQASGWL